MASELHRLGTLSPLADTPIYDIYIAARSSAVLCVAVHVGLFDRIATRGPVTIQEVKAENDLSERGADALLVALHSLKLLVKVGDKYDLSDLSRQYLVKSAPCYLGGLIELEWEEFITPQTLWKAMKTGNNQVYGGTQDVWEVHSESAQKAKTFTAAMHSISIRPALAFAQQLHPVFSTRKRMLDVGGGSGVYVISSLLHHPTLQGTVFELPVVCDVTEEYFQKYGVAQRASVHRGNMFTDPYPRGYDLLLYSQILHDWPRDKGRELVAKAYEALDTGGIIMINEKLLTDSRDGPVANAMVSLDMLVWTSGQQWSAKELFELLEAVGFKNPQVVPTVGYWSVVWATK